MIATLGIGLPILAHLLNRFQVQHTEWAAMQFLNRSVRVRSRQIKLRDLLLAQTRLNLEAENGDIQYAGEVVGYDVQPVNIQSDETAALNRLTITVNVRYVNTLDTEKNSEGTFTRFADYDSSSDLSSVEETLVREISDQLSQDIFDRTLGSW